MDRPLSQFIAPELIFQRRKESPRRCKQRIVLFEAGKIKHWLSGLGLATARMFTEHAQATEA